MNPPPEWTLKLVSQAWQMCPVMLPIGVTS